MSARLFATLDGRTRGDECMVTPTHEDGRERRWTNAVNLAPNKLGSDEHE
jgi:hypothetical protein